MIDWERVAQLRDEVGPEGFAEVVELFLEEVDEVVARLHAGGAALAGDLHFLKGSALNLGFERLGQLCQESERLTAGDAAAPVPISLILNCYAESRKVFLDTLDRRWVA